MSLHAARACILILAITATAPARSPRFDPVLENRQVSVFSLDLPPVRRAFVFQNMHDIFWIALSPGRVTMRPRPQQQFVPPAPWQRAHVDGAQKQLQIWNLAEIQPANISNRDLIGISTSRGIPTLTETIFMMMSLHLLSAGGAAVSGPDHDSVPSLIRRECTRVLVALNLPTRRWPARGDSGFQEVRLLLSQVNYPERPDS